ncbi:MULTISPECIES: aminotransferase class I/II-fold pyridoxal phosphate-dependent enzyme [Moraxella]|uniref:8-amino-7-oxononanoate synthase n=1 Tax=Moraxella catarrhalis TaxID=480 RepID=A0A7Z0UX96_MORCA|nr:8-amino-7-oxononanoate synthase [Moraxella catarrhalis]OAU99361.1 8-amino-7-oxononanoate synthase [Moraxella catarrhalis]STY81049.1 8-amino-7-oxononanoate synthase [Moraxella catarrhalis]
MSELLNHYADKLSALKSCHNHRQFQALHHRGRFICVNDGKPLLNLASNDYLGIAQDRQLYEEFLDVLHEQHQPFGSSSSRLLTGNFDSFERLEAQMASLFGRPCLLFNSGYHANIGILPAICDAKTVILADKLVHASIIDGMRLAAQNGTKTVRYQHQNFDQLKLLIEKYHADDSVERIVIATESIFSMDGDVTDLVKLVSLKSASQKVMLYVDEAHAIGARGARGLGCAEGYGVIEQIDFIVGAFGKAMGSVGGYCICHEVLRDYLINTMRPLIFSTALAPVNMAWTAFVLEKIVNMTQARLRLAAMSDQLSQALIAMRLSCPSASQIVPVILGENARALKAADALKQQGYYVLAVRPPTVPKGQSRLRICLTEAISDDEMAGFIQALQQVVGGGV